MSLDKRKLAEMSISKLIDRALYASENEAWQEALIYADEVVRREPNNYLAYKRQGLALWYMGKRKKAIYALEKVVELESDFASGHYNLACFYSQVDKQVEMLKALSQAIELDSGEDYRSMARHDTDFENFWKNQEFLTLTDSGDKVVKEFSEIFARQDVSEISTALLKLGKEIPLEVIDWECVDEGVDINSLLTEYADKIDYSALLHLLKLVLHSASIDYFEGIACLLKSIKNREHAGYDSMLIDEWKKHYSNIDAGHLGDTEHTMLQYIGMLAAHKIAEVALWGLNSHGYDAVHDYQALCASVLGELSVESDLSRDLVDCLDNLLHKGLYKDDNFVQRQRRIVLALPPPTIHVKDPNDQWASERLALAHVHPRLVVDAADFLSYQSDPDASEMARNAVDKLCHYVVDSSLPEELRCEAAKLVETLGKPQQVSTLSEALNDQSLTVLRAVGSALYHAGIDSEQAVSAVDTLLDKLCDDPKHDLDDAQSYEAIVALRWYKDERVITSLTQQLDHQQQYCRREALLGLGLQKAESAIAAIVKQLRTGSSQCVSAAAHALHEINSETSRRALLDINNYDCVLNKAKASPRFATKALGYFNLERVTDDLLELYCTLDEVDAYEVLAVAIAARAEEKSLLKLVELGLDRYEAEERSGRDFLLMGVSIARANPQGPNRQLLTELSKILSESSHKNIVEFTEQLNSDASYVRLPVATDQDKEAQQHYAKIVAESFAHVSAEAENLAKAIFVIEN